MIIRPRPLSSREHAALTVLLAAEFPGASRLREQAESVMADGEGLAIDLIGDPRLPRADVTQRVPVQLGWTEGLQRRVLLFVDEGRLSGLEYWWVTEHPPEEFPPSNAMGVAIPAREA